MERWTGLKGVVWDWGDTLMRDIPGNSGPMVSWPHVEAMPGAAQALGALSRLPVRCVATNATDSDGLRVAEALERVGLRRHLTHFFTSGELGVSKPDPAFFGCVAREVGISPRHLLSVGNDLRKDIVPAKAVGMVTVWVSAVGDAGPGQPGGEGVGEEEGAVEAAADLIVPNLYRLAELVTVAPAGGNPSREPLVREGDQERCALDPESIP
jgi:putative hydrolase of the HAD superfamily